MLIKKYTLRLTKIACAVLILYSGTLVAIDCSGLKLVRAYDYRYSYHVLLSDVKHNHLLLKQQKGRHFSRILMSIFETLVVRIAQSIDVPCNHVDLISVDECTQYKPFQARPATLHEFLPGVIVRKMPNKSNYNIAQRYRHLKEVDRGLTLPVIKRMANHPMFPVVAALDTFTGNVDRHDGNLIYDEETDTIYAIDFGDTFRTNLCEIAYKNLKRLRKNKNLNFARRELKSLRVYRNTLKKLGSLFGPQKLHSMLLELIDKAGVSPDSPLYADRADQLDEMLNIVTNTIFETSVSLRTLLDELDHFLRVAARSISRK